MGNIACIRKYFVHAGISMFEPTSVNHIVQRILRHTGDTDRPLVIGIAGPQGSGKSTITCEVAVTLDRLGVESVILCIDDFYFPKSERERLSTHVHALLRTRGVPGTHDAALLMSTISAIVSSRTPDTLVEWPRFIKKLDDRDTSNPHSSRIPTSGRRWVVLLEGWCVGCLPLTDIGTPVNELERMEDSDGDWRRYVDGQIRDHYMQIWNLIDLYIYISIQSVSLIRTWRTQQAVGNGEDLAVLNMDRFLQFYERISRQMMSPLGRIKTDITIHLAEDHSIESVEVRN